MRRGYIRTCKVILQQKKVPRDLYTIRKRRYEAIVNFFEEQNIYKFKESPKRETDENPEEMNLDLTRDNSSDRETPEDLAIPSCSTDPLPTRPVKKKKSVKFGRRSKNKKLRTDDSIASTALPESTNFCEATPTTEKSYATKNTQTDLIITHLHELFLKMIDDHLVNSFPNRIDFNDIPRLLSIFEQQALMSAMYGMPQQQPQWMPQQPHFNPANINELNNNYVGERIQDVQIEEIPVSAQDEQIEELPVYNIRETEKESPVEVTSTTKNPAKNQGKKRGKRKRLFSTKKSKTTASKKNANSSQMQ